MSEAFDPVFQALRDIMLKHASEFAVTRDAPGDLVVRTHDKDAKGQPGWFGAVTVKKTYVAYHLPPLYDHPGLADDLSTDLARRRQGKTCFNFKRIERPLFEELAGLTLKASRMIGSSGPPGARFRAMGPAVRVSRKYSAAPCSPPRPNAWDRTL